MELRRVNVKKYVNRPTESARKVWVLEPAGEAIFHQFGVDYEEFESGPANFTTAIIEWPDGSIENIPVHQIQFIVPCK